MLPENVPSLTEPEIMKVAIVGKPNVGKSMLLNARILAKRKTIVSKCARNNPRRHRYQVDFMESKVLLIDTAGIRKRGAKSRQGLKQYSVIRSMHAIDRCDVVALLVLDATEMFSAQDTHIAVNIPASH